jgi:hypothetical protein
MGCTHVTAAEGVVSISRNGSSEAVLARSIAQLGELCGVHFTGSHLGFPLSLKRSATSRALRNEAYHLHAHDLVMNGTGVIVLLGPKKSCIAHANQGRAEHCE